MTRGIQTSEFWLSAIGALVAAVVPLLIAYGVLDSKQGEMWAALILTMASIIVPVVIGSVVKNYNDNRAVIKTEAMGLERTALEVMRLEALDDKE